MLRLSGLSAGYGELLTARDVSLHVGPNEIVGLIGANGAGKTTLLRAICGLLPAREGRVVLAGRDCTDDPAHRRAASGLAIVLENRNLFGELTVQSNLDLALHASRSRPRRFSLGDIASLFPVLGEKRHTPVHWLSGGQQQMVAVGRALLLQPDVLLVDELSIGLAPKIVKDIFGALSQLRGTGMGMLLVEQNIMFASTATSRAYVMRSGQVVHEVPEGGWAAFLANADLLHTYLGKGQPE